MGLHSESRQHCHATLDTRSAETPISLVKILACGAEVLAAQSLVSIVTYLLVLIYAQPPL